MEEKSKSSSSPNSQSNQENKQISSTGQQNTLPPVLWIKTKPSLQTQLAEVKSVTSHEAPPALPKESKSLITGDTLSTEIKAAPYHDAILALPEEAKHMDCRDTFQPRLFPQVEADAAESLPINLNQPINSTFALGQIHQQLQRKVYATQQSDIAVSASASPTDIHRLRLLNELAANIIEQFSRRRTKTPALLQEVAALGSFADGPTVHFLLRAFLDAFEHQSTLNLDLMSALAQFLQQVDLTAFEMSKAPVELPDAETPASHSERLKATAVSGISSFLQDQASDSSWVEQAQDKGFELADRATQAIVKKNKEAKSPGPALVESKAIVHRTGHSNVNLVMQLLKVVLARYGEFIKQKETESEEIQILRILGKLFDAARGLGIEEFDEETLRDPAYKQLIERANATEEVSPELSLYANYAVQALLRLPQNSSLWKDIFQRGGKIIQAVGQLKEFWNKWDINELEGAYRNIREAFHIKHQAEPWYEALQYCQLTIRAGCFQALEEYLYHTNEQGIPYCMQRYAPAFQLGLMAILDEVLQDNHRPKTIHKACLALLKEMFLTEADWYCDPDGGASRDQAWLKKAKDTFLYVGIAHQAPYVAAQLLSQLVGYLKHPDLHDEAQAVLCEIRDKARSQRQRRYLKSALPPDFEQIAVDPLLKVEPGSELLQAARQMAERNLPWKLEALREQVLNNKAVSDKLNTYIPLATHLRDKPDNRHDLLTETRQLLGLSASSTALPPSQQAPMIATMEKDKPPVTISAEEKRASIAEGVIRDEKHTSSQPTTDPPVLSPLPKSDQKKYFEVDEHGRRVLDANDLEEHKTPSVEIPPSSAPMQTAKRELPKEEANARVLLLLGVAGSGKSTYSRAFERDLWLTYHDKDITVIPLWISLPNAKRLDGQLVENHLRELGFTQEHITQLKNPKTRYRLVLILDGYDETHAKVNLYQRNALHQWPDIRVVITCRPDYLTPEHLRLYFAPTDGDGHRLSGQLAERWVAPFDDTQVEDFLQQYVPYAITQAKQKNEPWKGWEQWGEYHTQLSTPGLKELAATPLTLQMLVDVLPEIVRQQAGHLNQSSANRIRRLDAYETFIQLRFEREANKNSNADLAAARKIRGSKIYHFQVGEPIEADYERFCKDLAVYMFRQQKLTLIYQHHWQLGRDGEQLQPHDLDPFFSDQDPVMELIRRGCPLERQGTRYSFSHKSFFDFFLAEVIAQEIMLSRVPWPPLKSEEDEAKSQANTPISQIVAIKGWVRKARQRIADRQSAQGVRIKADDKRAPQTLLLNERLLTSEPLVLQFLAERADRDEAFRKTLLYWVYCSRTDSDITIASANAITVLNLARTPFSNLNLSGIRIRGAQLQQAILDHTVLADADLRDVNFDQAFLRDTDFSGGDLRGAYFESDQGREVTGRCIGVSSQSNLAFFYDDMHKQVKIYDAQARDWLPSVGTRNNKVTMNDRLALLYSDSNPIVQVYNITAQPPSWTSISLPKDIVFSEMTIVPNGRLIFLHPDPFRNNTTIQIYNIDAPESSMSIQLPKDMLSTDVTSYTGDCLVFLHGSVIGQDIVKIYNVSTGEPLKSIELPKGQGCAGVTATPDGRWVLLHSGFRGSNVLHAYNVAAQQRLPIPIELPKDKHYRKVTITPNSQLALLYSQCHDDHIQVLDIRDQNLDSSDWRLGADRWEWRPEIVPLQNTLISEVIVSPDSRLAFLLSHKEKVVQIYDLNHKKLLSPLKFEQIISGIAFFKNYSSCVLYSHYCCYVYNFKNQSRFLLRQMKDKITQIMLLANGELFIKSASDVYHLKDWQLPQHNPFSVHVNDDGHLENIDKLIALSTNSYLSVSRSELYFWQIQSGKIRLTFSPLEKSKYLGTHDGRLAFLYPSSRLKNLDVYDVANQQLTSIELPEELFSPKITITPDNHLAFLYNGSVGGNIIQVLNIESGKGEWLKPIKLSEGARFSKMTITPDSRFAFLCSDLNSNPVIYVLNIDTGEVQKFFKFPENVFRPQVLVTSDSSLAFLCSAGMDSVYVIEVKTDQHLKPIELSEGMSIREVAIAGRLVFLHARHGGRHTIQIYDISKEKLLGKQILLPKDGQGCNITVTPDGQQVIICSVYRIWLYDINQDCLIYPNLKKISVEHCLKLPLSLSENEKNKQKKEKEKKKIVSASDSGGVIESKDSSIISSSSNQMVPPLSNEFLFFGEGGCLLWSAETK